MATVERCNGMRWPHAQSSFSLGMKLVDPHIAMGWISWLYLSL